MFLLSLHESGELFCVIKVTFILTECLQPQFLNFLADALALFIECRALHDAASSKGVPSVRIGCSIFAVNIWREE